MRISEPRFNGGWRFDRFIEEERHSKDSTSRLGYGGATEKGGRNPAGTLKVDIPTTRLHMVDMDRTLRAGSKKISELPNAYDPTNAYDAVARVFA